jgi:hypothetical protein
VGIFDRVPRLIPCAARGPFFSIASDLGEKNFARRVDPR